jgi:RimJ/RimL family protein N-acetyltransferase
MHFNAASSSGPARCSMDVTLRVFQEPDIACLDMWARRIGSEDFMSRYRPKNLAVTAHSPEQGLLWFVIRFSGRDVGTVWLEGDVGSDQAVLGILLGEERLLGLGIGQKAINLALENAQQLGRFRTVVLNVRENNTRAIACYKKCGFDAVASGVKRANTGTEIHYLTMQRSIP